MYNSYKEIVWLLNLMNTNDRRGRIETSDIFDKKGNLKKNGEELLIRKATGYISFVRGENPYTFPYRVYPNVFAKKNTFNYIPYPSYQMNLKKIKNQEKNRILNLYLIKIGNCENCGNCQYCAYKYIIFNLRNKNLSITTKKGVMKEMPSFENMESFGYTLLQTPLEALIISFPYPGLKNVIDTIPTNNYSDLIEESFEDKKVDDENMKDEEFKPVYNNDLKIDVAFETDILEEEGNEEGESQSAGQSSPVISFSESQNKPMIRIDPRDLTGKNGLKRIMNFVDEKSPPIKGSFEYKKSTLDNYGKIFSRDLIGNYSAKIKNILDSIVIKTIDNENKIAEGVILIYSQYIDSGLIPVALALEEMGFTRYGENVKPLFKNRPSEVVDVRTMKPPTNKKDFIPARYSMITGDPKLSPNNVFEVKGLTNEDNVHGNKVKIVLISKAGSEGIDLKFIRQVHILEPWYNMNRIEQIIGRAVRNFSHKDLEFEKRNVQIFMYGTILENNKEEAADLYVYRVAEYKAVQIGHVTRVLKETAVDCIINHDQTNFTQEIMSENLNEEITQELSTGLVLNDFKIGDAPFSPACDYMAKCNYDCIPNKKINDDELNEDTYNENFIRLNSEKIIQKIRLLMKERFFYNKDTLLSLIQTPKVYPYVQIYAALTNLIEDNNEFIVDRYGRNGRLINIGDFYLFQPVEILDKNISIYDRSTPIDFKHNMINFEINQKALKPVIDKRNLKNIVFEEESVTISNGKLIFKELNTNFETTREYTKQIKVQKGDDNWYKHCGIVLRKMTNEYSNCKEYLLEFLVAHMIELLLYQEKLDLLNYIYSLEKLQSGTLESLIKDYFERRSISTINFNSIILYDKNKRKIMTLNDENEWVESRPEEQRELAESKEAKHIFSFKISDYNNIIGFIGYEKKNNYMVFKTKDMLAKRDTGARCDEAGKIKTIQTINKILNEDKFTKENTKILKDTDGNVIQNAIGQVELCVYEEFILRYFDRIKKNNKKWFLTPEMAIYHKIYTVFVK